MKWSVPLTFEMGCRVIVEGDNHTRLCATLCATTTTL